MFKFFTVFLLFENLLSIKIDKNKMLYDIKNIMDIMKNGAVDDEMISGFMKSLKILSIIVFLYAIYLIEFIYFLNAVSVDIFKYPTYAMILLVVVYFIKGIFFNKNKVKIDEDMNVEVKTALLNQQIEYTKNKLNSPCGKIETFIIHSMYVSYFVYMIFVVFFM